MKAVSYNRPHGIRLHLREVAETGTSTEREWISGCQGLGGGAVGVTADGSTVSSGDDKNILALVVMAAQLHEYTENYWCVHFKREFFVRTYFFLKKEGKVNMDFTGEKLEFKSTVWVPRN